MNLLEAGYDYRCVGSIFADWCINMFVRVKRASGAYEE